MTFGKKGIRNYWFETRTPSGRLFVLERRAASVENAERAARKHCKTTGLEFVGAYKCPARREAMKEGQV